MKINETTDRMFFDLGFAQKSKKNQSICGDAYRFRKLPEEGRIAAVLSDGLGSGVKANILGTMTATMALKFAVNNLEVLRSAEIIMSALPICRVRKISYATFTIVDVRHDGKVSIVEMGNPGFILMRGKVVEEVPGRELTSPKWRERTMKISDFTLGLNDRLIFFSDGISQAGMGSDKYPLGWRRQGCIEFTEDLLDKQPDISAHELAGRIQRGAQSREPDLKPGDDMTCAVIYTRLPKKLILFTGPPYDRERDYECARMIEQFDGKKVLCGGTTAEILSRELKRELTVDLKSMTGDMPPISRMEGIDLVTEGIFTLTRTAQYLEKADGIQHPDAAGMLVEQLLCVDIIELVVGTRINEAHQNPDLPVDLEIRRNIVKRIATALKDVHYKEVTIRYV